MSPKAAFGGVERYPNLTQKAAALGYHLAKAHACPKGNKRVALILLHAFLYGNGEVLGDEEAKAAEMIAFAAASKPEDEAETLERLSDWIREEMIPSEGGTRGST